MAVIGGSMLTSCSDSYMEKLNTDETKAEKLDPNAQLTTGLLQTYGDFGMMDAYRCYVTGFTQYYAGGWNVSNYAGAVHADNDMMRTIWDQLYNVSIKNLVDAIYNTDDRPNLNAALHIHRAYLMAVLTDTYGDVPCTEAGLGFLEGIANPKYDTQKDIYYWIFDELETAINQLGTGNDRITGDVTSLAGDVDAWKRYANSLRMRYAMRLSKADPEKAKAEFLKALNAPCGYIDNLSQNAYVKYIDGPFTLYDGSRDLDFRVNALGEMLYGQDSDSPTFVSRTLFDFMKDNNDPRLYRICRHYINNKRSAVAADDAGNYDVTDEVVAYQNSEKGQLPEGQSYACNIGAAWWHNWVNAPANEDIPTLAALVAQDPEGGYDQSNYNARMLRPFLSIKLTKAECPGILMTNAETNFLLAEAAVMGWIDGEWLPYCKKGVEASLKSMNEFYGIKKITDEEIGTYIENLPFVENPLECINTQAWIHHLMNPAEGWANLRRSDYPVLEDRYKYDRWTGDFTYDDDNLQTPTRLKYPNLEAKYNTQNYQEALSRMGGTDDWHHRVWWDVEDCKVK